MSYQRPDGNGRYYVWMGVDGLHIVHDGQLLVDCKIENGPVGRDNAKAILRGLVDYLSGEGVAVSIKHGEPVFKQHKGRKP